MYEHSFSWNYITDHKRCTNKREEFTLVRQTGWPQSNPHQTDRIKICSWGTCQAKSIQKCITATEQHRAVQLQAYRFICLFIYNLSIILGCLCWLHFVSGLTWNTVQFRVSQPVNQDHKPVDVLCNPEMKIIVHGLNRKENQERKCIVERLLQRIYRALIATSILVVVSHFFWKWNNLLILKLLKRGCIQNCILFWVYRWHNCTHHFPFCISLMTEFINSSRSHTSFIILLQFTLPTITITSVSLKPWSLWFIPWHDGNIKIPPPQLYLLWVMAL